jgi:ABC-type polysaccharide/polyol phosphate export permease
LSSELNPLARRPVEQRPVRVVSAHLSMRQRLRAIWDSRELLTYLVTADIKIKYKGTALGVMWSMVAPALSIGVYFLIFQVILKNGVPDYVVMLWAGMLVWTFFSAVVVNGTGIVVQRSGINKIDLQNVGIMTSYNDFFVSIQVQHNLFFQNTKYIFCLYNFSND